MSVVVASAGRNPAEVMVGHEGFGLVALRIEDLAELGLDPVDDPQPDEPDHALVVGNKTQSKCRQLAKRSTWIIPPPPVS